MPTIAPIAGAITFATDAAPSGHGRDISTKIAPPYDLVTEQQQSDLLSRDAENIVRIDVPHLNWRQPAPDNIYQRACEHIRELIDSATMIRADHPQLFVIRQSFLDAGRFFRRVCLVADVAWPGAAPGARTGIHGHEETEAEVWGDRLALIRACRTQTSPILGLYSDPNGLVEDHLREVMLGATPILSGMSPDLTLHEVWRVSSEERARDICERFGDRDIIIADGHNRYEANERFFDEERISGTMRTMFALVATQDLGMTVRPVHRVFSGVDEFSMEKLESAGQGLLQIRETTGALDELPRKIATAAYQSPHSIGLVDFQSGCQYVAVCDDVDPLRQDLPDRPSSWRRLPPVICQELLNKRMLRDRLNGGRPIVRRSAFSIRELLELAAQEPRPQVGAVVRPAELNTILELAINGHRLPPDSTFFWPKIATGLVMKSFD